VIEALNTEPTDNQEKCALTTQRHEYLSIIILMNGIDGITYYSCF
jgi:hypothetical protein